VANSPVEKAHSGIPWWLWLLGLVLLGLLLWFLIGLFDDDDVDTAVIDDLDAVESVETVDPVETAAGPITSIAELADGRNAVGREVDLDDVRVLTLTGDSSFFAGAGPDAATEAGALIVLQGMNESASLPPPPTGADGMYNVDEGDVVSVEGVLVAFDETVPDYADLPAADRDRALRSGVYINATDVEASGADTEIDASDSM
jgi:hypothetical protein